MFYLYRKSSGEIEGMSETSYGNLEGDKAEIESELKIPLDKPHVVDGLDILAATPEEISEFDDAVISDQIKTEKEYVKDVFDYTKPGCILIRSVVAVMLDEINLVRKELSLKERKPTEIRTAIRKTVDEL